MNINYLKMAFADNKIIQLTHQQRPDKSSHWKHGWFNDPELLLKEVERLNGQGNLFISLNKPYDCSPSNTVDSYTGFKNNSIERHTRLLIDLDPVRNGYISSTDTELNHATDCMNIAIQYFQALGWPRPALALSGNGRHLLFRTILPNNSETSEKLASVYTGLKAELSNDFVDFDATIRNPCRISMLYSMTKRKGLATPERPHRQSNIILPQQWQQVSEHQIDALANHFAVKVQASPTRANRHRQYAVSGQGDYSTLDAIGWFQSVGLYLKQTPVSYKHWVTCPWSSLHSGTGPKDSCLYTESRIPTFSCSHDHCSGKNIFDVIEEVGGADHFCSRDFQREA